MQITLRPATFADADFLYNLHQEAMQIYIEQTWGQWDEAWQAQRFREYFDPAATQVILYEGEPVGMIGIERRAAEIFLSQIALLPAYQGRGVGAYLISAVIHEAHQEDMPVTLQVLKVNPARRLYERLGFVITAETASHYLMTALPNRCS
jgi:ribosomal protein S18 acetylase RimI-like enzyme